VSNLVLNPADSVMVWVGSRRRRSSTTPTGATCRRLIDFTGARSRRDLADGGRRLPSTARRPPTRSSTPPSRRRRGAHRAPRLPGAHQPRRVRPGDQRDRLQLGRRRRGAGRRQRRRQRLELRCGQLDPSRVLLSQSGTETAISPSTTWITTGRPAAWYGHIHNANDLPYDDPCGGLDGSGARLCNWRAT